MNERTGNRAQILGVAYQPGGEAGYKPDSGRDALSNGTVCLRDAALMQGLGVNAIRVVSVSRDIDRIRNWRSGSWILLGWSVLLDEEQITPSGQSLQYTCPVPAIIRGNHWNNGLILNSTMCLRILTMMSVLLSSML